MTKVVLDTNLIIAGRWNSKSSSLKIIDLCISGSLKAVYTREVRDENLYILGKVKTPRQYLQKIERFYENSMRVESNEKVTVSRDHSDNRFLEAALAGCADYVISNDHHLLEVEEYRGVKIMRPSDFMKLLP
ncbi:MAG: putative toxin-antitoxin system toxin component, PIN family [Candidatus Altiarchaeota archaeon]|nr:putative toxin-antitoxin system toxin component, PIN family [Candidatus Altiarchaeota archaeon]